MYDLTYGPGSGATTSLTVSSGNSSSSAVGRLGDHGGRHQFERPDRSASALQHFTGASTPMFSDALMSSLQKFPLGG